MASAQDIDRLADKMQEQIKLEIKAARPRVNLKALHKLQRELAGAHIAFHQAMQRRKATQARREAEKILRYQQLLNSILFPPDPLDIRLDIGRRD